jgi:hypothetical protein
MFLCFSRELHGLQRGAPQHPVLPFTRGFRSTFSPGHGGDVRPDFLEAGLFGTLARFLPRKFPRAFESGGDRKSFAQPTRGHRALPRKRTGRRRRDGSGRDKTVAQSARRLFPAHPRLSPHWSTGQRLQRGNPTPTHQFNGQPNDLRIPKRSLSPYFRGFDHFQFNSRYFEMLFLSNFPF